MAEARKIYVLNGPNINMLGTREPEIYGYDTLDDIAERMEDAANRAHVEIDFRQSNHEGHLVDWLQEAHAEGAHAVILNAAGLTHSSIALHDAIKAIAVPVIEVHLSNRSEEHTSELQSLMRISYAVFCLKKKSQQIKHYK